MKISQLAKYKIQPLSIRIKRIRLHENNPGFYQIWYQLNHEYYPVELQRGEIKNYKSINTLFNDLMLINQLSAIPLFFEG